MLPFVSPEPLDLTGFESTVVALTVRALPQHAMLHGACRITDSVRRPDAYHNLEWSSCPPPPSQGEFAQIIHMGGKDAIQTCIRPDGMCDMVRDDVIFTVCQSSPLAAAEWNSVPESASG